MYEFFAVALVGPVLALAFDEPIGSSLGLALVMSTIALSWNYLFNLMFERWEARQPVGGRSALRRLIHGLGFEGGLLFILVPVLAFWLDLGLVAAFLTNLGLFAFFFVYAIVFTWAFDKVFGLPASAGGKGGPPDASAGLKAKAETCPDLDPRSLGSRTIRKTCEAAPLERSCLTGCDGLVCIQWREGSIDPCRRPGRLPFRGTSRPLASVRRATGWRRSAAARHRRC